MTSTNETPKTESHAPLSGVMPSGFTLEQENVIWGVIRHLSKEQYQNPTKVWKRDDVFKLIKDELEY